jgi:hypothetical protein
VTSIDELPEAVPGSGLVELTAVARVGKCHPKTMLRRLRALEHEHGTALVRTLQAAPGVARRYLVYRRRLRRVLETDPEQRTVELAFQGSRIDDLEQKCTALAKSLNRLKRSLNRDGQRAGRRTGSDSVGHAAPRYSVSPAHEARTTESKP